MADPGVCSADSRLVDRMSTLADQVLDLAPRLTLMFVTNIRDGELVDVGPCGVSNAAQHYTRDQAEGVIRSFQELGVTVESYFSEREFIARIVDRPPGERDEIVYTTAEGGTGSGRRALLPSMCSLLRVPILNSGAHASALARHKLHANAVLSAFDIRVPRTWQLETCGWTGGVRPPEGTRVIVKPAFESMSIGVNEASVQVVDDRFDAFVEERMHDFAQPLVVQDFVTGAEVGVPLVRIGATHALPALEVRRVDESEALAERVQTFDDRVRRAYEHVPYVATATSSAGLAQSAVLAFDAIGMSGVGRMDFRIDADGRAWLFDTNEAPPPLAGTAFATAMDRLGFPLPRMLAVWLGVGLLDAGLISGV